MPKPILCLDFDGVCNSYSSGWQGIDIISDPPVLGLFEFIAEASRQFDVQIYSSRSRFEGGIEAMREWFEDWYEQHYVQITHQLEPEEFMKLLTFPDHKPPAKVSIDDRAITFTGTWPDVEALVRFQPWTKGKDNLQHYKKLKRRGSNAFDSHSSE